MNLQRVVITGLGAITPIGGDVNETWNNAILGKSGANTITLFDATKFRTKFACEVKDFDPIKYIDKKEVKKTDRFTQMAIGASIQAIDHSEILVDAFLDKERVGVIISSGIGGLYTFQQEISEFSTGDGTPRFNPYFIPKLILDIAAGIVSMKYNFMGPNFAVVSACASSTHALIAAMHYIKLGKADVIICGGSESVISASGIGGFNAMRALSESNDNPKTASRPFDKDRNGFVMGEGSGILVLESLEHAKKRGAKIYAELAGGGATADAYHMTAPHPDGLGASNVMEETLKDALVNIQDIDYINVHGTSTPLGDLAETKAIQKVFKNHAYNLNISATKSMTGHLLGAAGAVESLFCIKAIMEGVIPPTINHFTQDEQIDPKLNLTLNKAQERKVNIALSNTFGFGGHNASVIFKKFND